MYDTKDFFSKFFCNQIWETIIFIHSCFIFQFIYNPSPDGNPQNRRHKDYRQEYK